MAKEFSILEEVMDEVKAQAEWWDREVPHRIKDLNPDAGNLRDEDVAAFAQHMLGQYPPEWYTHPDGRQEFNSIWIIELRDDDRIEGGRKLYERMKKVLN